MERFIAALVKDFESGKVDRREFCTTVALAATVYAAGDAAQAQPAHGFKVLGVNHISYTCPDYTRARDFFINVFGLENAPGHDTGQRANLMFGPEQGKGGSFIVTRNPAANNNKPASPAYIDHFCFTLSNWNEQRVRGAIKARGLEISGGRNGSLHVLEPNFHYDIQFANDVEENAFRHGT
jgi:catechol 2,3-dioxygenase-like lactoylglutathione lyase family enzyme